MGKGLFRTIDTSFWLDAKVAEDMSVMDRYMFIYLLTNPHTNLIGCYELTYRTAAMETELQVSDVKTIFAELESLGVISYDCETREVLITNWLKHNLTDSPKMRTGVEKQLAEIKSETLYKLLSDKYTQVRR